MEDEIEKQKKHLTMVERLSKCPQSRSTKPKSSTESTSSVLSHFSQLKTSIEFQLQQSQSLSSDPPNLKLHFQSISESISDPHAASASTDSFPYHESRHSEEHQSHCGKGVKLAAGDEAVIGDYGVVVNQTGVEVDPEVAISGSEEGVKAFGESGGGFSGGPGVGVGLKLKPTSGNLSTIGYRNSSIET
ncbi:uncharacterized protein HKW66_Vig0005630 [Vigna angularis]|uniref:Tubulin-specific chaperone C N-terminal domain-containing protein n=1 Tax=Phaseolus angularis TaxID=3914 RepID=A0A8T0LGK2_PHAAN|nr:uncharacterized protein HKW66_Vig0005630 [Vigna angularis]